jgi:prepilin signal peptidase PulO-like enzyme (type II secretory pathway)
VFIAGILIGGVLNCLADDLPRRRALRLPHYPDGELRPVSAWLGITAFALGRHTSSSGRRLSVRHPLTELATGLLFVIAVLAAVDDREQSVFRLLFWFYYLAALTLITVIDMEHRLILFVTIIPSAIVAVIDAIIEPLGPNFVDALIGGAVGFGIFYLLYQGGFLFVSVSNQLRERQLNTVAFGYGDVMLMTVVGLMLGWQSLIPAMFITVFLGAAGAIAWLVWSAVARRRQSWATPLPYGPYIVIAAMTMLIFANEVGGMLLGQ